MTKTLEDEDGNPREGDILKQLKKELRKMKVDELKEDSFKTNYQEEVTYYLRDTEGARSRRDQ